MPQSSSKFTLLDKEDSLRSWIESNVSPHNFDLDEKIVVVSVIGKSGKGSSGSKADLIDESIERNVFKHCFGSELVVNQPFGCEIEGYCDPDNRVVFLHLVSVMDSDILAQLPTRCRDVSDRIGFLSLYNEAQVETAKCLLFLFSISHIVLINTPSLHFDTSSLNLFRIIESGRELFKPYICDALTGVNGLARNWVETGRPCSPRVLFVFEPMLGNRFGFHSNGVIVSPQSRSWISEIVMNRRKYELKLEDQIYRFMRRCRIITNICSNSLFAICNQMDFVYLCTESDTIKDSQSYLNQVLFDFCSKGSERKRFCDGDIGTHEIFGQGSGTYDLFGQGSGTYDLFGQGSSTYDLFGQGASQGTTAGHYDLYGQGTTAGHGTGRQGSKSHESVKRENGSEEHSFYNFLFNHINTAHTKGFDDNVGRHNVIPVFETPTVQQFFKTLITLRGLFFDKSQVESSDRRGSKDARSQVESSDRRGSKDASGVLSKHFRSAFEADSFKFTDSGSRSKVIVF